MPSAPSLLLLRDKIIFSFHSVCDWNRQSAELQVQTFKACYWPPDKNVLHHHRQVLGPRLWYPALSPCYQGAAPVIMDYNPSVTKRCSPIERASRASAQHADGESYTLVLVLILPSVPHLGPDPRLGTEQPYWPPNLMKTDLRTKRRLNSDFLLMPDPN